MIAVSLVLPTYLPSLLSRALLLLLLLFSNAITIFSSAASFASLDILPTRVNSALLLLLLVFLLLRRFLLSRLVQVLALKNSRRRLREVVITITFITSLSRCNLVASVPLSVFFVFK